MLYRTTAIYSSFLVLFLGAANPVLALNLDEAKQQGLVGEQSDGYLGARSNDSAVKDLVNDINNKRKEEYKRIATKNGTTVAAVEALAGEKTVEKTAKGNYVRQRDGSWVQK